MSTIHTGSSRDVREKEHTRRELLSKYLYDVSKLVIATLFLVNIPSIIRGDISMPNLLMSALGISSAVAIAWSANRILIY